MDNNNPQNRETNYFRIIKEFILIDRECEEKGATMFYNDKSFNYNEIKSSDYVSKDLYEKCVMCLLLKFEHKLSKGKPIPHNYRPNVFTDTNFIEEKYQDQEYINPRNLIKDSTQTLCHNFKKYNRSLEMMLKG